MFLNNISFGPVWGAAGVQNFDGNGYPYHKYLKPFGLDFGGVTLVSKTFTIDKKDGHMPLERDGMTPIEFKPRAIYVDPLRGVALNAIDLSNFGLEFYLSKGIWEHQKKPFLLSFMAVGKSSARRMEEYRECARLLNYYRHRFHPLGLQINISCFNTGLPLESLLGEVSNGLRYLSETGIPLQVKINALTPIEIALDIALDPNCHSICVSNAIPYGSYFQSGWWKSMFGSISPLAPFGNGALSGEPLRGIVCQWIYQARKRGLKKPINGGGGILSPIHVEQYLDAGADSVFLGSIAFLRPWRVGKTIEKTYKLYGDD